MDERPGRPANGDTLVETTVDADETPTGVVLTAVAAIEDVPVIELPPLYDRLDPDALNRLFGDVAGPGCVVFPYAGFLVCLTADGNVSVHEHAE